MGETLLKCHGLAGLSGIRNLAGLQNWKYSGMASQAELSVNLTFIAI
jgi:hypothetical protein